MGITFTKSLLVAGCLFSSLAVSAANFDYNGISYNITSESDKTIELVDGANCTGSVVIPNTVSYNGQDYTVTSIGESAFEENKNITSVSIPNTVESISHFSFFRCEGLTDVEIPNSVNTVGIFAFYYCTGLESATVGEGVTRLGGGCFEGCSSLKTLNYNAINCGSVVDAISGLEGDGAMDKYAFDNCPALGTVNIGDKVTYLPNFIFMDCSNIYTINIPNSVTYIGDNAFSYCTKLNTVTMGNSVEYIGLSAFNECGSLKDINFPESVSFVGNQALGGTQWFNDQPDGDVYIGSVYYKYKGTMPSGTTVTLKDGTKSITDWAFSFCSGMNGIVLPESLTQIGERAFYYSSNLSSLNIPEGLEYVGPKAFDSTSWITSWYNSQPNGAVYMGHVLYRYKGAAPSEYALLDGTTQIAYNGFYGCSAMKSITIPSTVRSIGEYAFRNCSSLKEVHCDVVEPLAITDRMFYELDLSAMTLYVDADSELAYSTASIWSDFGSIVGVSKSGIANVTSQVIVSANNGAIVVNGANANALVKVFDVKGNMIYSGTNNVCRIQTPGLYLVNVQNRTYKVVVK